eukprot:TRINITY_DN51684_c0_g1_i2.p1 TRINITY_DN51684_c0_g1~~TRINITY_DN51684_c0_g1_i2.p1  ORF type:complete len:295 (-),score=40.35 TRINITY_DN51684_c0_g1_i2:113-997(-)
MFDRNLHRIHLLDYLMSAPEKKRATQSKDDEGPKAKWGRVAAEALQKRFQGARVLVTGGAAGIGRSIVDAFASEGAHVVAVDVSTLPSGTNAKFIHCDCSQQKEIEAACKSCIADGGIDILVNNVGMQLPEIPCHESAIDGWDKTIAVNLTSYYLFSKYLLPGMVANGKGIIINICSVQGLQSQGGIPAYAASKGGVLSLTRQLSIDYAAKGVRVNAINPGTIDTELVKGCVERGEESYESLASGYPMKRIGQPVEIAKVALFLASDDASFMTGENVTVDGGIMALGGWAKPPN